MKKEITLMVDGDPLVFDMSIELHNRYTDEMTPFKKVAPSRNLLVRAVRGECKAKLVEILDSKPGAIMQITQELFEHFSPDIEIVAGE